MAHCPISRRASDAGRVATCDHHCRRAGPPGEDEPPAGSGVFPIRGGAGGGRAPDRGAPLGQAVSRPASGGALRRPWPRRHGRFFPPEVALHVVRLACERPDLLGRSLSPWDGPELARQLIAAGIVANISAATVRRMLAAPQLNPWRQPVWLSPQPPRDAAFYATVSELLALDTRPRGPDALVWSVDETTSLQPRPRQHPPQSAQPKHVPTRYEHEDQRAGALNRLAAFDTRSGKVDGQGYERKRQREGLACLEPWEAEMDERLRTIPLVCDHVSTHPGQAGRPWLAKQARVVLPCTPVHGAWLNHVAHWCSSLPRTRVRMVEFESKDHLRAQLDQFIKEGNQPAHPFNGSTKSVAKIMAAAPALAA